MLDDPRVNFAISTRGRQPGLDHLGIQVEGKNGLNEVSARLREADGAVIEQGETRCCYAKSAKAWIDDPSGIAWETFQTTGESTDSKTDLPCRGHPSLPCALRRAMRSDPWGPRRSRLGPGLTRPLETRG